MNGNDMATLENAHLVGGVMHLDNAAARAVRHAVEVAIDRDHAVAGNATLEAQYRLERTGRELLKPGALLREMLRDDALGRGVYPDIGYLIEPLLQLLIEILEIAEAAAEEEVFADVAIWPLDFALRLRPIRLARLRQVAVMPGKFEQRPIVDDVASLGILAAEHGSHAVVEYVLRHTTQRLECRGLTAQQRRQVLVQHEAGPQHATVAQHEREQPKDPLRPRLVSEHRAEVGEVDLRLTAGRRLEAHLERRRLGRPDVAQEVRQNAIAASVAKFAQLAMQTSPAQLRKRRKPLAQIARERRDLARPRHTRTIHRRLQATLDVTCAPSCGRAQPAGQSPIR